MSDGKITNNTGAQGTAQSSGLVKPDGTPDYDKIDKNRQKDLENNLMMNEIQRKTNSQNSMITAISTLQKGADDVMRAIANNLK